jgi:uncharacterized protein YbjT (DUF2867 family)
MSTPRRFLIAGATGKQGGAVVSALLDDRANLTSNEQFDILCLTRDVHSPRARSLASKPGVSLIQGDLFHAAALNNAGPLDGVFCVTTPGKPGDEERQARALIDASVAHGVRHFVFTSVDRGGEELSEKTATGVSYFASKHRIEEYLKKKAGESEGRFTWTILRPVAFMDNLTPDFMGKAFASLWEQVGEKPLQLVSTKDIGKFAAEALLQPQVYKDQAVGLAGDELNFEQASKIFKEEMGYDMPRTFGFVACAIKLAMRDMRAMFGWFKTGGYAVDIRKLRLRNPEIQDFRAWLKEKSGFKPKGEAKQ